MNPSASASTKGSSKTHRAKRATASASDTPGSTVSRAATRPARRIAPTSSSRPDRVMIVPSPAARIVALYACVRAAPRNAREFRASAPPRSWPASGGSPSHASARPVADANSQTQKMAQPGPARGASRPPCASGVRHAAPYASALSAARPASSHGGASSHGS